MPTFYLTKYTLTRGMIERADGCEVNGQYATRGRYGNPDYVFLKIGVDAHPTLEEARARVVAMVDRKIKGLAKERTRLEKVRDEISKLTG